MTREAKMLTNEATGTEEFERLLAVYIAVLEIREEAQRRAAAKDPHAMQRWNRLPTNVRLRVVEMVAFYDSLGLDERGLRKGGAK